MIALLDVEVGDAAKGGCAHIDIGLWLDLAGAADDGGQILARDRGGKNLGVAGLRLVDHQANKRTGDDDGANNQKNLFHKQ